MRAFYDPAQAAHNPSQMMRHGRIVTPKDLPERTARLLQALVDLRIPVAAPEKDDEAARVAVHTAGFLHYLSTAWERWQALPDHGPEVWPNTFPYWSGRPEDRARPDCPAAHILAQTGWYLGDLSVSMGPETWRSVRASANTAVAAADAIAADRGVAYALCRPSGHHARADRASGFCFLNNTAIAAQHLRTVIRTRGDPRRRRASRRRHAADLLFAAGRADRSRSTPIPANYYPFFTGYAGERGIGAGDGFNLNLPLAHGSTGEAMFAAVDRGARRDSRFQG